MNDGTFDPKNLGSILGEFKDLEEKFSSAECELFKNDLSSFKGTMARFERLCSKQFECEKKKKLANFALCYIGLSLSLFINRLKFSEVMSLFERLREIESCAKMGNVEEFCLGRVTTWLKMCDLKRIDLGKLNALVVSLKELGSYGLHPERLDFRWLKCLDRVVDQVFRGL
jgi:hypothetical protein